MLFRSGVGGTSVREIKYLLATIPARFMRLPATKKRILRKLTEVIAWDLSVLAAGRMPAVGMDGEALPAPMQAHAAQPVAGPWRAAFGGIKHDTKARKELHMFLRSYAHTACCDSCFAEQHSASSWRRPHLLFHDFSADAGWRATMLDHTAYLRVTPPEALSPWALVPGWKLELCFHDVLHVLHLGILRDACASALVELAGEIMAAENPAARGPAALQAGLDHLTQEP